ncbi:MAG: MGMT family protein [Candidatus Omnitrophica bacterium]|nr:MGMT family protein [Candidatus Omnitrophota bacterium]
MADLCPRFLGSAPTGDHRRHPRNQGSEVDHRAWAPAIPCHRVIAAGGGLGGYSAAGGLKRKRRLLRREGVHC